VPLPADPHRIIGSEWQSLKRSLYCSEAHEFMVSLLKTPAPCDELLDRIGIIAGTEAAQRQIGINDAHASDRAVKPKFEFCSYGLDVPMRFKRPRIAKLGLRVCPKTLGRIAEFSEHEAY
jgi:hypothetical protein